MLFRQSIENSVYQWLMVFCGRKLDDDPYAHTHTRSTRSSGDGTPVLAPNPSDEERDGMCMHVCCAGLFFFADEYAA